MSFDTLRRNTSVLATKALHTLSPETAHRAAMTMLRGGLTLGRDTPDDAVLRTQVLGLAFDNPVGLAAGFDKGAEAPNALLRLGFGFVEVGTITPLPQPGNPKPRVFRDPAAGALVNRMGFNGKGLEAAVARLEARERRGIVGANFGRNLVTPDVISDYVTCLQRLAPFVDYLVINISSPNTKGLRDMQAAAALTGLLTASLRARDAMRGRRPLLVKIAPDLDDEALADLCQVALAQGIDGLIVSNTSLSRPAGISAELARETGGLSGPPIRDLATETLRATYRITGGKIPLVGVGGVVSAEDAWNKILAGASLVQLYTALIFEGPGVVGDIKAGLGRLVREHGFSNVAQAVGTQVRASG